MRKRAAPSATDVSQTLPPFPKYESPSVPNGRWFRNVRPRKLVQWVQSNDCRCRPGGTARTALVHCLDELCHAVWLPMRRAPLSLDTIFEFVVPAGGMLVHPWDTTVRLTPDDAYPPRLSGPTYLLELHLDLAAEALANGRDYELPERRSTAPRRIGRSEWLNMAWRLRGAFHGDQLAVEQHSRLPSDVAALVVDYLCVTPRVLWDAVCAAVAENEEAPPRRV